MHREPAAPAGLHLEVPADPESVAVARHAVRDHASLSAPAIDDLLTVVSELVANAVTHAGLDCDDVVTVDVSYGDGSVVVEVTDSGPGFDVAPARHADERGGFGLHIVAALSTAWGSIPGAGRVWAELPARDAPMAS